MQHNVPTQLILYHVNRIYDLVYQCVRRKIEKKMYEKVINTQP